MAPATDPRDAADRGIAHHTLAETFDTWADEGRGDSMERGHWPTARQALDRLPLDRARVFLDLGCGNGYAARYAAARMPSGGVALGLDVAPRMIESAQAATESWNMRRHGTGAEVRFLQAPFDAIPLPGDSIDVAFSHEALYYAPDTHAALSEAHRVLRRAGRLAVCLDYYLENTYSHGWARDVGVPMTLDSEAGWRRRFERAGYVDVETTRLFDPTPVPPLPLDAADDARRKHEALVAWRTTIGTLFIEGDKD